MYYCLALLVVDTKPVAMLLLPTYLVFVNLGLYASMQHLRKADNVSIVVSLLTYRVILFISVTSNGNEDNMMIVVSAFDPKNPADKVM